MARVLSNGKRRYLPEFRAWVVKRCLDADASLAGVALANGLNANLVRKWVVAHRNGGPSPQPAAVSLLPVEIQAEPVAGANARLAVAAAANAGPIELEIHGARLKLHGDVDGQRLRTVLEALARRR